MAPKGGTLAENARWARRAHRYREILPNAGLAKRRRPRARHGHHRAGRHAMLLISGEIIDCNVYMSAADGAQLGSCCTLRLMALARWRLRRFHFVAAWRRGAGSVASAPIERGPGDVALTVDRFPMTVLKDLVYCKRPSDAVNFSAFW